MTAFPSPHAGPVIVLPEATGWESDAEAAGWRVVDGAAVEDTPWDLAGTIVRTDDAAVAGAALARSGSVAPTSTMADLVALVDDARRAGASMWPRAEGEPRATAASIQDDALDRETEALLGRLAAGMSVGEAAAAGHMSLRTAQRKLAAARSRFRVTTTPGAVAAWRRSKA